MKMQEKRKNKSKVLKVPLKYQFKCEKSVQLKAGKKPNQLFKGLRLTLLVLIVSMCRNG